MNYRFNMNSAELEILLEKFGCTRKCERGKEVSLRAKLMRDEVGHLTVFLGDRKTVMPDHPCSKELGKALIRKIKIDLGIE